MNYDLVVIGGGFAALAAIKRACERNLTVCCVSKDFGASQFFSGAFDVIDPSWENKNFHPLTYPKITDSLKSFIRAHPNHLYSQIGAHSPNFEEGFNDKFFDFFKFYEFPVKFAKDQTMIATFGSSGGLKFSAASLFGQGLEASVLNSYEKALFINIPFLKDYPSHLVTQNLAKYFKNVRVATLTELPFQKTSPYVSLISCFDDETFFEKFRQLLKEHIKKDEIVFLPPILGTRYFKKYHEILENEFHTKFVELLSVLPSVAGLRVANLLGDFFSKDEVKNKISIVKAKVVGFNCEHGQIKSIKCEGEQKNHFEILGTKFLLATGKYIGEGIKKSPQFVEALFNLPLFALDNKLVSPHQDITTMISQNPLNSQEFLNLGLKVDESFRPIDQFGKAVYQNLKAAGHVLCGFDFTRQKCGFGVSFASGTYAAS